HAQFLSGLFESFVPLVHAFARISCLSSFITHPLSSCMWGVCVCVCVCVCERERESILGGASKFRLSSPFEIQIWESSQFCEGFQCFSRNFWRKFRASAKVLCESFAGVRKLSRKS